MYHLRHAPIAAAGETLASGSLTTHIYYQFYYYCRIYIYHLRHAPIAAAGETLASGCGFPLS